jgi:hypothetical protein
MATVTQASPITQIGETAGIVWKLLIENESLSLAKLTKMSGESRDVVMQAVGWLAREGKVVSDETSRGRVIWLR